VFININPTFPLFYTELSTSIFVVFRYIQTYGIYRLEYDATKNFTPYPPPY